MASESGQAGDSHVHVLSYFILYLIGHVLLCLIGVRLHKGAALRWCACALHTTDPCLT